MKPQGDKIVVENRRYVLGRGLKEDAAFRHFFPAQLGLSSDLEVQVPNSIQRIVKPGAGFQFVHGGASLQEIVVPVISINKGRADTVEPVNVEIHPESDRDHYGRGRGEAVPIDENRAAPSGPSSPGSVVLRRFTDLERAGASVRFREQRRA